MDLQIELGKLKSYMGGKNENAFKKQVDFIQKNFTSEADKKALDSFITRILSEVSMKTEELILKAESILVHQQLKEVNEMVSISY